MKRLISIGLVLVLIMGSFNILITHADKLDKFDYEIIKNELNGSSYTFQLNYKITNPKKGEVYTITTPFPINIKGGEYLEVTGSNGSYNLTVKDDFEYIKGSFGGTKTVTAETTFDPITIDGSIIPIEYPDFGGTGSTTPPSTGSRDDFYKVGQVVPDKGIINWQVSVKFENGVNESTIKRFEDQVGDGQELIKDSITISYFDYTDTSYKIVDNKVDDPNLYVENILSEIEFIDDNYFTFDIWNVRAHEGIYITYNTKITDTSRDEFYNQVEVTDFGKISEKVVIEDWSDIDGGKPTPGGSDKTKFTVSKKWLDVNGNILENVQDKEIEVYLLADGKESDELKITLNESNGWTYTFTDLPLVNSDGDDIVYTVKEVSSYDNFTVTYNKIDDYEVEIVNKEKDDTPKLPQVGEFFFKWQYLVGIVLLAMAYIVRKKK